MHTYSVWWYNQWLVSNNSTWPLKPRYKIHFSNVIINGRLYICLIGTWVNCNGQLVMQSDRLNVYLLPVLLNKQLDRFVFQLIYFRVDHDYLLVLCFKNWWKYRNVCPSVTEKNNFIINNQIPEPVLVYTENSKLKMQHSLQKNKIKTELEYRTYRIPYFLCKYKKEVATHFLYSLDWL